MSVRPRPVAGLRIVTDRFDSAVARRLIAALDADLDDRYAADDAVEGEPDHAMLNVLHDSVAPPRGAFLVAYLDGQPVGCGALRPAPTSETGELWPGGPQAAGPPVCAEVKRMWVEPAARRRGISRALLAALETQAAAIGYRRIILETGIRQGEAMALYESSGYEPIANYGAYRESSLSRCYTKELSFL